MSSQTSQSTARVCCAILGLVLQYSLGGGAYAQHPERTAGGPRSPLIHKPLATPNLRIRLPDERGVFVVFRAEEHVSFVVEG